MGRIGIEELILSRIYLDGWALPIPQSSCQIGRSPDAETGVGNGIEVQSKLVAATADGRKSPSYAGNARDGMGADHAAGGHGTDAKAALNNIPGRKCHDQIGHHRLGEVIRHTDLL